MACLVPIVEGESEVASVPVILRRLGEAQHVWAAIATPVRGSRGSIVKPAGLERKIAQALHDREGCSGVLIVLDADDDCAAELGPELAKRASAAAPHIATAVVLPVREFEAWFLASIESLRGHRGIREDAESPHDPESIRGAKEALQERMEDGDDVTYASTDAQPAFAAVFDFDLARQRSRSFCKFEKEALRLLEAVAAASPEDAD